MDWSALDSHVAKASKRIRSIGYLLGPLSVVPKEKVRRVAQRIVRDTNPTIQPKQVIQSIHSKKSIKSNSKVGK